MSQFNMIIKIQSFKKMLPKNYNKSIAYRNNYIYNNRINRIKCL